MSDSDVDTAFDALIAAADYPVWVLTTAHAGRRAGCLVGFCGQIGIEPRRFLAGVSHANHTFEVVAGAEHIALHLLPAGDLDTARLFATETGDEIDKFAHCASTEGPHGLPILTASAAWFAGKILSRNNFGDHTGILLEPIAASPPPASTPVLRYHDVADLRPGHPAG